MLGMLKAAASAVAAKVSEGNPITDQVKMVYEELVAAIQDDVSEDEIPRLKVKILQEVEGIMLTGIGTLMQGVAAVGKPVTETEARRKVIGDICDLKLTALERDGNVNLLQDLPTIKLQAMALKAKAQMYLTNLCMRQGSNKVDSAALDQVEDRLLDEVTRTHSENYEKYQRAAQGAIAVVADIRLARMGMPRVP